MDVRHIVEELAREMLALTLKPIQPKLLFIFCDCRAHEAYSDQFIFLDNEGIMYDLAFLDGETSAWLGLHKVESLGSANSIAIDEYAPAPLELPKEYDGIVIPEIDLDNASRIAAGQKGSVKAEIVFAALLLEKPVWIGKESPGIKRSDRRTLKVLDLPKGYAKLFRKYMSELEELGVTLVASHDLARVAASFLMREQMTFDTSVQAAAAESRELIKQPLISADWVTGNAERLNGVLELSRRTIVSPLARDVMREKGIVLQYIDKG